MLHAIGAISLLPARSPPPSAIPLPAGLNLALSQRTGDSILEMRAGQYLVMRSSQPPPLPSLLRPANGVVFSSYSPFSALSPRWIRQISLFSRATIGGPREEWKQFRWPRSKFPASIPFPFLAGRCVWNLRSQRAYQASDSSASIDSNTMESMENKIKEKLNAIVVTVKDAYGDGRHVSIDVVSAAFEGQSAVNRQRMVYKAIWEELESTVHAVDHMTTRTPSEAAENQ